MTNNTFTPETTPTTTTDAGTAAATAATPTSDAGRSAAETTAYPTGAFPTPPAYPAASQPAYPSSPAAAPQPQYYPVQPKNNVLGIVTLVLGILGFGLIPVITGHIALGQIKRTGEEGRGITLAGLILGYVTLAGWLVVAFFWVAVAAVAVIGSAAGVN